MLMFDRLITIGRLNIAILQIERILMFDRWFALGRFKYSDITKLNNVNALKVNCNKDKGIKNVSNCFLMSFSLK